MKKEAPVNFFFDPLDGRSTLRPTDVMVSGVSPLVGLGVGAFTVGQTALKIASRKVAKHDKRVLIINMFLYYLFDTFGILAPDIVDLLHRVQRVLNRNTMSPRSMNVVFTRIDFTI